MKLRLQTTQSQHLVLTPQLRQALRLLQMSAPELDAEIDAAVESNPLLDWVEPAPIGPGERVAGNRQEPARGVVESPAASAGDRITDWEGGAGAGWDESARPRNSDGDGNAGAAEAIAQADSLQDHLLWQLHLSPLSPRDIRIAVALIDAIDEDGYLRESLDAIAAQLGAPIADADAPPRHSADARPPKLNRRRACFT